MSLTLFSDQCSVLVSYIRISEWLLLSLIFFGVRACEFAGVRVVLNSLYNVDFFMDYSYGCRAMGVWMLF